MHTILVRQSALWCCETWPCLEFILKPANSVQLQERGMVCSTGHQRRFLHLIMSAATGFPPACVPSKAPNHTENVRTPGVPQMLYAKRGLRARSCFSANFWLWSVVVPRLSTLSILHLRHHGQGSPADRLRSEARTSHRLVCRRRVLCLVWHQIFDLSLAPAAPRDIKPRNKLFFHRCPGLAVRCLLLPCFTSDRRDLPLNIQMRVKTSPMPVASPGALCAVMEIVMLCTVQTPRGTCLYLPLRMLRERSSGDMKHADLRLFHADVRSTMCTSTSLPFCLRLYSFSSTITALCCNPEP